MLLAKIHYLEKGTLQQFKNVYHCGTNHLILNQLKQFTVLFSYPGITRWNFHYNSITKILIEKDKLHELFIKLGIKQTFKENELEYLDEYCKVLSPLATALDVLQEHNTYYEYLLPCIATMRVKLNKLKTENLTVAGPVLNACIEGLQIF